MKDNGSFWMETVMKLSDFGHGDEGRAASLHRWNLLDVACDKVKGLMILL